jgi:hypothetical protein
MLLLAKEARYLLIFGHWWKFQGELSKNMSCYDAELGLLLLSSVVHQRCKMLASKLLGHSDDDRKATTVQHKWLHSVLRTHSYPQSAHIQVLSFGTDVTGRAGFHAAHKTTFSASHVS